MLFAKFLEDLHHVFVSCLFQVVFGKTTSPKVERVVLNTLADAPNPLRPSCAFGDSLGIGPSRTGIFGEADPPKKERVTSSSEPVITINHPLSRRRTNVRRRARPRRYSRCGTRRRSSCWCHTGCWCNCCSRCCRRCGSWCRGRP